MPRRPPNQEQFADFHFPIQGIDLSKAFDQQATSTTPVGLNVRAFDPLTARARGGQRPGLAKYIPAIVGSGGLIQDLNSVVGVGYTPPGPTGAQGFIQNSAGATGSGTISDTFSRPTTAGNGIVVIVGVANGAFATSITDSAGNTYLNQGNASISSCAISVWLASSALGASGYTAHVNPAYTGVSVLGFEVAAPATLDQNMGQDGVGNNGTSAAITTTSANEWAVLAVQTTVGGHVLSGPGGAWILPMGQSVGNTFLCAFQNLYAIATGLTGSWTFSGNPFWCSANVSFVV